MSVLAVAALIGACGGGDEPVGADPSVTVTEVPGGDKTTEATTSPAPSTTSRLPLANETDLVILGSTREAVEAAVAPYDGEFIGANEGGAYQVRFAVSSLDELLEIEAELEDQGFSVQLNFADDEPAPSVDG